jgi:hypothetical protein
MTMAKNLASRQRPIEAKTDDVVRFDGLAEFAVHLGVELSGSVEERADSAAQHMSRSQRHMLASGILLMSIRAECEHGQFSELITGRGFEERAARRAMQYAQFVLSRPEGERDALLDMPKFKVLALAGADPEVVEAMLENGTAGIDALSVRALQQELADTKAALADAAVQRDTAEAELTGARKRLAKGQPQREDAVPLVVADLRAEIAALAKKAELSVESFRGVGNDVIALIGTEAHDWADATLRLAVSALGALHLQLGGVLTKFIKALPDDQAKPKPLSYLTRQEVIEAAQSWAQLIALHDHEKALREWDAQQKRPRGKGRPTAKPEAPKGAGA